MAEKHLAVTVAGETFSFALLDPSPGFEKELARRFGKFVSRPGPRPWRITLTPSPAKRLGALEPETAFRGGKFSVRRSDFAGSCRWSTRSGEFTVKPLAISIDSLLRVLLSEILLPKNGFLLHAAGARVSKTTAAVFPAPSDEGKSTLVAKVPPRDALSDEIIAVRRGSSGWMAESTPFHGTWGGQSTPLRARIAGIYFLKKQNRFRLVSISASETVRRLLPRALFYRQNAETTNQLLQLALELANDVPAAVLSTRLKQPWSEIREKLERFTNEKNPC